MDKISISWTVNIVKSVAVRNSKFFCFIAILALGLAYGGNKIIGGYHVDYLTFRHSYISIFMAGFGRIDPGMSSYYETNSTLGFFTTLYMFSIFCTNSILISYALQGYFKTISKHGYYAPVYKKFDIDSVLYFVFFFMPDSYWQKEDNFIHQCLDIVGVRIIKKESEEQKMKRIDKEKRDFLRKMSVSSMVGDLADNSGQTDLTNRLSKIAISTPVFTPIIQGKDNFFTDPLSMLK